MKKLFSLILVLALIGVAAVAETTFTPAMFLGSRGLVVMDEKQLGGNQDDSWKDLGVSTLCVYSISTTGNDAIAFTDNGTMYAAFNMTAMFGGGGADLSQVYADFCRSYDFDCYMAVTEGSADIVSYIHSADFPLDKYEASGGDVGMLTTSLDSFLESVAELAANRPEPEATPTVGPTEAPTEAPAEAPEEVSMEENTAPAETVGIDGEFTLENVTFTVPGVYRYTENGEEFAVIRFDWTNNSNNPMDFSDCNIYATVYQDGVEVSDGYARLDTNTGKNVLPGYSLTSYRVYKLTGTSDVVIYLYGYDSDYDQVNFTNVTIPYDSLGKM